VVSEFGEEVGNVANNAKESMCVSRVSGYRPLQYFINFCGASFNPTFGYMVSQKFDFSLEEFAFLAVAIKACFAEGCHN
jgi:hypothetical protein